MSLDESTGTHASGVIGGRDHVTDFDLDSPEYTEHYDEVLDALLDRCPVARSEAFGGYRVVARAEDFTCRDPRVIENPTVVDLDRRVPVNLAFSYGPHRCMDSLSLTFTPAAREVVADDGSS